MKNLIFLFVFISSIATSQTTFELTKKGLSPKQISLSFANTTSEIVFEKTASWIETNKDKRKLELSKSVDSKSLKFTATQTDVRYSKTKSYYVKVYLKLDIKEKDLSLSPYKIELKQNSKYDMGWKELDLDKPYTFFKNIKGNKKSFLNKIAHYLNELKTDIEKSFN